MEFVILFCQVILVAFWVVLGLMVSFNVVLGVAEGIFRIWNWYKEKHQ